MRLLCFTLFRVVRIPTKYGGTVKTGFVRKRRKVSHYGCQLRREGTVHTGIFSDKTRLSMLLGVLPQSSCRKFFRDYVHFYSILGLFWSS